MSALQQSNLHSNKYHHQNRSIFLLSASQSTTSTNSGLPHLRWNVAELERCLSDSETSQKSVLSLKCLNGLAYKLIIWPLYVKMRLSWTRWYSLFRSTAKSIMELDWSCYRLSANFCLLRPNSLSYALIWPLYGKVRLSLARTCRKMKV
jgi:hypothetical protein